MTGIDPASTGGEPAHAGRGELRRVLGMWDAAALIVGIIVGSGIFATPPIVARELPGTGAFLAVWVLGGLYAACGALTYAELTALFPVTGGAYAFLREGYGRFPAFAYGWTGLLVTYPASIAAVGVVFAAYFARLVPAAAGMQSLLAAALCLVLAGINILGVRLGAGVLRGVTGAKVLALVAVGAAVFAGTRIAPAAGGTPPPGPEGSSWLGAFAIALAAVIWTYDGWTDGPSIAGEMRDPHHDVPRALLLGTLGITAVYLLVNVAYVRVLGIEGIQRSDSVAVDVSRVFLGSRAGGAVAVLVLVSTLGSMLGMIIGYSRVFFAMGRDRLFFSRVGDVSPRFGTPAAALAGIGIISALYAGFGTFEGIIRLFVLTSTLFLLLNVASVFIHRRRLPHAPRPVRVPLYPWVPLLYLGVGAGLVVQLFLDAPRDSLAGLALVAAAAPVFVVWERFSSRSR